VEQGLEEVRSRSARRGEPGALERYRLERFEEESARLTREIPLIAQKAAVWAEQAGYSVPAAPVEELLKAPCDLFIQWGFFKLLYRLGLTDTDFDPEADN
jgi:hypothetical protein